MKYEQIDIDPGFAQALLEASAEISQRTMIERRVAMFAADMTHGNWRLTHQAVAIDPDGRVLDGQHRLTAIVRSGVTVPMMVCTDADPATFGVIDTGKARTPSDALKIAGFGNVNMKASIARLVLTYDRVRGTRYSFATAARLVTSSEIQEMFLEDLDRRDRILSSEAVASRIAVSLGRHGLRAWMGAAHVVAAESMVGESAVAEFFERVNDGAMLPVTSPILALRRYLVNDTGVGAAPAASRPGLTIATTVKALNDYTQGRDRTTMVFKDGREDFPVVVAPDPTLAEVAAEQREQVDAKPHRRRGLGQTRKVAQ